MEDRTAEEKCARLCKELKRLQKKIHDQKADNRRLQAERNLAVRELERIIKYKNTTPCATCRKQPDTRCLDCNKRGYMLWEWKGVHTANGGIEE